MALSAVCNPWKINKFLNKKIKLVLRGTFLCGIWEKGYQYSVQCWATKIPVVPMYVLEGIEIVEDLVSSK